MLDNRKFIVKKNSKSIKKKKTNLLSKNFLSFDKLIYHPEKLAGFKIAPTS